MGIPEVIDELVSFEEDHTDPTEMKLVIRREQVLPDDWISNLKAEKIDTTHDRMGEFYHFARIPIGLVHKWDREGYPWEEILKEPTGPEQIKRKLDQEAMDAFWLTRKRI